MLVDYPAILRPDAILKLIGNGREEKRLTLGVYQLSHFGSSSFPMGVDRSTRRIYGVCDNYAQVIEHHPEVNDPVDHYVISITPVLKSMQPKGGGWRWHKWGGYIGKLNPQHEYLSDEDDTIQQVFVYQVYKVGSTPKPSNPESSLRVRFKSYINYS